MLEIKTLTEATKPTKPIIEVVPGDANKTFDNFMKVAIKKGLSKYNVELSKPLKLHYGEQTTTDVLKTIFIDAISDDDYVTDQYKLCRAIDDVLGNWYDSHMYNRYRDREEDFCKLFNSATTVLNRVFGKKVFPYVV